MYVTACNLQLLISITIDISVSLTCPGTCACEAINAWRGIKTTKDATTAYRI